MRARLRGGLAAVVAASCLAAPAVLRGAPGDPAAAHCEAAPTQRIVSLNPSLTAILVAIGARGALVGVDAYSPKIEPAVADLPTVGGLYSPSLEAVVALQPDLVVLVPSAEQRDFRGRLDELGISVLALDPIGFDDVLSVIETLGCRAGAGNAAHQRVEEIRRVREAVVRATRDRPRPRAVLVLQRDPLFVAGQGSFIDEMLAMAGAENLGAELADPYPRASHEWLVARGPEVILDSAPDAGGALEFWSRWPSLPAVRSGRVRVLPASAVTLPGPRLDLALLELVRQVQGEELAARIGSPR
jgi:iron complex transport system substrate-binding protein